MARAHPILLLLFVGLLAAPPAGAELLTPFSVRNENPLVQIFGLPGAASATVLSPGESAASLNFSLASNYTRSGNEREALLFDGETSRLSLELRRGLGKMVEVSINLPWVAHRKGFLDQFIIDWHRTFALPQGGRDQAPHDRLAFRYRRDGVDLVALDQPAEGFGDLRLGAAWQILRREEDSGRKALALRTSLKLPTGDSERLLGSGSTDLALWLAADRCWGTRRDTGNLYGAAGLMLLSDGQVLPGQQRNLAGFATLGGGWAPWRPLAFKIQLDGHTPFYGGSELDEIAAPSVQLTLGGTLEAWAKGWLDLGVSEDLAVSTAPDVVFHIALRSVF